MAGSCIRVATWNINGLGDTNKKHIIKQWIRALPYQLDVLCLQETRAEDFRLNATLSSILPGYSKIISPSQEGRGGTAILLHPNVVVRAQGILANGRAAWAQISTADGDCGIVNIYAPHSRSEKAELWTSIKDVLPTDDWTFCGDFNMIESLNDSTGISNLLRGGEMDAWRLFQNRFDCTDAIRAAHKFEGSRYTRRGMHGGQLIQSRLDRFYLSSKGWWAARISKLEHIPDQATSDHDPAVLHFALALPTVNRGRKRTTHFKANPAVLRRKDTIQKLKEVWEDHNPECVDPRLRFAFACDRLRAEYIKIQDSPRSASEELSALRADLVRLKLEMAEEVCDDAVVEFLSTTDRIREIEGEDATRLQKLSRMKWLGEGEEPSKYFFRLLKAKQKREDMPVLIREDGTEISDHEDILKEGHMFYSKLFATGGISPETVEAREKILQPPSPRVSRACRYLLEDEPTMDELRDTLLLLPFDKSPGMDGLTPEVLRACWHFMGKDLLAMILKFWETGTLAYSVKDGLIKLIPKKADKRHLKDWRPLTMLTTTYKLIAKLLALRLRVVIPFIISSQQTGFIPGRNILENISVAWLTADWLNLKRIAALFLKLDFEKAFDRVEHSYLWEAMLKLGCGEKFISLIQGLIAAAVSKLHINGMYSDDIPLERGVRQGCPISPLLFAIATQPLMAYLSSMIETGELNGIQIQDGLTICFRLFADDMGMFIPATEEAFNRARSCIAVYEAASGAKLNLAKSTIVPFQLPTIPQWLIETRCHICQIGEVTKYLGGPWGVGLADHQLHQFSLNRVSDRLKGWAASTLTFPGRIILLKHVLMAIPVYHMMVIHTPAATIKKLEGMAKEFLWGHNKTGGRKLALVSWEKVTRIKRNGGLGIRRPLLQANTLLCRWVLAALDKPDTEWARLFRTNLSAACWLQGRQLSIAGYSLDDRILLGHINSFKGMRYTAGLWNSWITLRTHLSLHFGDEVVPGRWRICDLIEAHCELSRLQSNDRIRLTTLLSRLGVRQIGDINRQEWSNLVDRERRLARIRGVSPEDRFSLFLFLDTVLTSRSIETNSSVWACNWRWRDSEKTPRKFSIPNHRIYALLDDHGNDTERLNRHWRIADPGDTWAKRWDSLWKSDLHFRAKVFIWRILAQGLYTGARAGYLGHDVHCLVCRDQVESSIHLFAECKHASKVWKGQSAYYRGTGSNLNFPDPMDLIKELDDALRRQPRCTAKLFIMYHVLWDLWTERNKQIFEGRPRKHLPSHMSQLAEDSLFALCSKFNPGKKLDRLRDARTYLKLTLRCRLPEMSTSP